MNGNNKIKINYLKSDNIGENLNISERNHKKLNLVNIDGIANILTKMDYLYNTIILQKQKHFYSFNKKIISFQKYVLNQKYEIKIKINYFTNKKPEKLLLYIIIPIFKRLIDNKHHKNIKNALLILIKLCIYKVFPKEIIKKIIECILNIIINISKNDSLYTINDEPFTLINDIIISLSKHPKEIKMKNIYKTILFDIIDLFENYFFNDKYKNIILTETPIWLNLLGNYIFTSNNQNENYIIENTASLDLNNKLNNFLIKIYKFSLRSEYIENIIIKNSIMDFDYYLNSINFLTKLFWEEIRDIHFSDFKISEGNFIPNNKFLFFNDVILETKNGEISIIFSFKILRGEINKVIEILEFFDQNFKSVLKLYINEKECLILELPENKKKLETNKKIKKNVCYLLCISINKNKKKSKIKTIGLFINSKNINENNNHNEPSYFILEKINSLNLSQNLSLVLGKNNFFGIIGDFLVINKELTKDNCKNLFNLSENYAKALRKIYYKLEQLPFLLRQKYKAGYNRSKEYKESFEFFQKLEFKLIFDMSANEIYNIKSNKLLRNIDYNYNYLKDFINNNINNNSEIDFFTNKKNINLFKNISKMKYSYDVFYQNNGIDFIIFQLYNFFSKISDIKLLNKFLLETLSFIMEIISYSDKTYINLNPSQPLFEQEMSTFFLVLLNILNNKKGKIFLDNELIMKLIEFLFYFKKNKLMHHKNMIYSILLDVDFYQKREDIFQYRQIFDSLKNELKEKTKDNKSIINKEFLYKLLILDFCFETKNKNHKLLMELIAGFISYEEENRENKQNKYKIIHNKFISYFLSLENEKKIYHYLKIIYFNFDKIKSSFSNNADFILYINPAIEKINSDDCKYCSYNKILLYLIYQEIINLNNNNDRSFNSSPINFIKNISKLFLKCFFSQVFCFSLEERFTFIKKNTDDFNFIFTLMKEKKEIFDFEKFNQKFENIINYIKTAIQKVEKNETYFIINDFFKYISNSLKKIVEIEKNNSQNDGYIKLGEQKNNLINLLSSKSIKNFFDEYISLNCEDAFEDLKYFITNNTLNSVVFPFYFQFFANKSIFTKSNDDDNKFKPFDIIVDKLVKYKIDLDIIKYNNYIPLIKNNIYFLICLYNLLINKKEEINQNLEPTIPIFLNYLIDNNFVYSKYIFDINLNNKKDNKENNENKFILEMICDIYFHFYEKGKFDKVYEIYIEGIFLSWKKNILLDIDLENYKINNNKNVPYFCCNQKYLENVSNGEDSRDIMFSIYFMVYLLEKLENYKLEKNNKDAVNMLEEIISLLCNNAKLIFKQHIKNISNSSKNISKKKKYKIYCDLFEFIKNKYKSDKLDLDSIIKYYKTIKPKKFQKIQNTNQRKYTEDNLIHPSLKTEKNNEVNNNIILEEEKNEKDSKLSITKDTTNERYNTSSSQLSTRKTSNAEILLSNDNNLNKGLEENNKINNNNLDKIEIINEQKEEKSKDTIDLLQDFEVINNISINKNTKNLKEKLKELNIPSIYYKKIFEVFEPNLLKKVFNPKEYYIWNKFSIILKDIIFSQKKFIYISKFFALTFGKYKLIKSSYLENREFSLKYPTKLKNFICDDYYRPFVKPDLNFFNNKFLHITHDYLNPKFLKDDSFTINKISQIEFPRIIPINYNPEPTSKIICEYIDNNGSYFGYLYFNHSFLLFVSESKDDPRNNEKTKMNINDEKFYLYSFFLDERIFDKKKYILMFYSEIKEVLIRRFNYHYIGYEFFMKNNKAFLFNFFNKKNLIFFITKILSKFKKNNSNDIDNNILAKNLLYNPMIKMDSIEGIDFKIIHNLPYYFDKAEFNKKHLKGKLSNFQYLLLINKFSARSYNDLFQYLIFPLLFMDSERKKERDLSKVIALNKSEKINESIINKIKFNYDQSGNHFNTHYSTSGYVLYYLVRMTPFTSGQIKLQSNKFDSPSRMFLNFSSYLKVINSSEENRELIPEFFYSYEAFLNLNKINLGYIYFEDTQINDLDTGDKNGIAEFIINMRQQLERVNILPWVDIFFGCYQDIESKNNENLIHKGIYNIFPLSSYEKKFNKRIKEIEEQSNNLSEIIRDIKLEMNYLSVGMSPLQLFNSPLGDKKFYKNKPSRNFSISIGNTKDITELNYTKIIQNFLNLYLVEKNDIFIFDLLTNENNEKALVIKDKNILNIFKLFNNENNNNVIKIELRKKEYLKIYPLSKMFCKLNKDIFLSCRYIDKIIQINYANKDKFYIYHDNIITSVEYFSHQEKVNKTNISTNHINQIFFGDEKGNLNLMKIEYEINNKNEMKILKPKILKTIKAHNSLIQGIIYVKRLNIIISFSEEGQITINNAFDFCVLNIIELGEEYYIKDIQISKYDLIYILCTNKENEKSNYIKCYSLNGIKFTELKTIKKMINFFIDETLVVIYENNLIDVFNLYDIDGKPLKQINLNKNINKINTKDNINNRSNKIIICVLNNIEKKLVIIYDNFLVLVEDLSNFL